MKKGKGNFDYDRLRKNILKYKIKNKTTYLEMSKRCNLSYGFLCAFCMNKYYSDVAINNLFSLCKMINHKITKYIIK